MFDQTEPRFSSSTLMLVQQLAEGLSETEALDYLGYTLEELTEEELGDFKLAYRQGRAKFKFYAVGKLKESMAGRNGMQASLAALTRFAEEWPSTQNDDHNGVQRTFKIVLDGGEA